MSSTRRGFLKGATALGVSTPLLSGAGGDDTGPMRLEAGAEVEVSLSLNGEAKTLTVLPETTLADALREGAEMTGTKLCCEGGACGACTVLVDGAPVPSCLSLAVDADARTVDTVEGLGAEDALHPLQRAFIDADALQCGYCTPGFLMSARAFYDAWRAAHGPTRPPRDEVVHALAGNLCRCGAQPNIIEAVQAACASAPAHPTGGDLPGRALPRADALEKVTGRARYCFDVQLPKMLHAAMLRAPLAHAGVKKLDVTAAEKMPGVRAVTLLLPKGPKGYGTLRWVGQEIAAVAADTDAQARAARDAIVLELDARAPVTSRAQALADGAPTVWSAPADQDLPMSSEQGGFVPEAVYRWDGNARGPMVFPLHTDNDAARALVDDSPVRASFEASTAVQVHTPLERHGCVAEWADGALTLHATTQTTQILQADLAEALELPSTKVRVLAPYVGGGFGCKAGLRPEHLAAARLAKEAGRPVRLFYPLRDHLTVGGNRPGTHHTLAVGADGRGRMRAVVHAADNLCGAGVGERGTGLTDAHYAWEEKDIRDRSVVTHTAPSCPWRAPGFPPNAFALEQAVDDVAAQLGEDPLQMRVDQEERRRFRAVYRLARAKARVGDADLKRVGAPPGRFARGVGVATAEWFVLTAPNCRVELRATRDGQLTLSTATHDMGQGARSVLQGVACEMLRLPASRVTVKVGDSDLSTAPGSFGSITTGSIAPATMDAVEQLKAALQRGALAKMPGVTKSAHGVLDESGHIVPFSELFAALPEEPFVAVGHRGMDADGFALPPPIFGPLAAMSPFAIAKDQTASAHVAEVEVDRLLGAVRVRRVVTALDAGRIASPRTAQSQVMGAVMQGVSYALYEARRVDARDGRVLTHSFDSYGILGIADAPDVEVHFLPAPSKNNPYGTLGLGENSIVAVAAAVANGVFRALGKRVLHTPMRPERVRAAMEA